MIQYDVAQSQADLETILQLQQTNLARAISVQESIEQGFVTVEHDLELLTRMNDPFPHIVARDGTEVIGYTLVMLPSFGSQIPVLVPMFDLIDALEYQGQVLSNCKYFVMGQVCIAKAYRGQGVFKGLYQEMKRRMSADFDYIITEIVYRNQRSLQAHYKVGFKKIKEYHDDSGEHWVVVLWEIGG